MKQKDSYLHGYKMALTFIYGGLVLFRLALSSRLPSYLIPHAGHDDGWVFRHANFILRGEWLGPYNQFTLIKGIFSPLLLAFSVNFGVTFNGLNTVIYCLSCTLFIVAVQPIIKNDWLKVIFFAVLLFNPIPYAMDTGQRIYRNGIGQWEILLIFGCIIALFLRRNEGWKSLLKWSILGGLSLGAFLQTREDAAWIYPFVVSMAIVTSIFFLTEKKDSKSKIVIFLLPLLISLALYGATAVVNYVHYGAPILNDRSGGNFAKVAGDLNSIAPNADEDKLYKADANANVYFNIYVSSMEKAFAASPTLRGAEEPIREWIRKWSNTQNPYTGQPVTDHMLFALRDGVSLAGHYRSLPEAERFYSAVHQELQAAFESGTLVKRGFLISPLVVPLQKGDLGKPLFLMPMAIFDIINFRNVSSAAIAADGPEMLTEELALMAGGDYYTSQAWLIGGGWAFAKNDGTHLTAGIYNKQGELIQNLPLQAGQDVFSHMQSRGLQYENAKFSRFSFKLNGYDLQSGITLRFLNKNGHLFKELPLNSSITNGEDGEFIYFIDRLKAESPEKDFYSQIVGRANNVIALYQVFIPYIALLASLIYCALTILMIREVGKEQELKFLPTWLVLSGILFTFMLFMLGMCIIKVTTFNSLVYMYTAPAYVLLLMFCGISICWGANSLYKLKK